MPEITIIFFWTLTLILAFEEGRLTADHATPAAPDAAEEANLDVWLRDQYKIFHSDLQWAKDRSFQAVRLAVLLIAGLVAANRYYSFGTNVSPTVFVILILATGLVIALHVLGLHRFAAAQRDGYLKILARYPAFAKFVPVRGPDRHHIKYLVAGIAVIALATWLGIQGVLHVFRPAA